MGNDDTSQGHRAQAEAWLAGEALGSEAARSGEELAHELHVVRLELELARAALQQARTELQSERQRSADLFDQAPVGLLTLTRSALVLEANVSAATLLGVTRAQLLDQDFTHYVAAADRPLWHAQCAEALAHGAPLSFELTLGEAEGTRYSRRVLVHCRPGAIAAGPVLRLTLIDVSGRQATEDLLRKLSLAVEQSPESIVITDLAGEIEYVNDAFVRIAGYPRETLIGRNMSLLQSGKTARTVYADMWQTLAQGRPWHGRFTNRREDGSEYVESAIITPLRQPDGRITHYVAVKQIIAGKRHGRAARRAK